MDDSSGNYRCSLLIVDADPAGQDRLRIGGLALADPRTVQSFFEGRPVRPLAKARIRDAALKLGYALPAAGK